jgi:hypothetical protein
MMNGASAHGLRFVLVCKVNFDVVRNSRCFFVG